MDVFEAMRSRRTIKQFTDQPVTREEIERVLDAAVLAPNHRLTQPWRFHVLGARARASYGAALAERKARKVEDPAAAEAVRAKVIREHEALPAMIAVSVRQDENPEVREEDYAATMIAVQNLCLAATALGLGTHIKTGGVMQDPAARAAVGVGDGERIVAIINLGRPASVPDPKPRKPATDVTSWVD